MKYGKHDLGDDYGELTEIGFGQQALMNSKEAAEIYYSGGRGIKPKFELEDDEHENA